MNISNLKSKRRLSSAETTSASSSNRFNMNDSNQRRPLYSMLSEDNVNKVNYPSSPSSERAQGSGSKPNVLARFSPIERIQNERESVPSEMKCDKNEKQKESHGPLEDINIKQNFNKDININLEDESADQVIPIWPSSKSDAIALGAELISSSSLQHKVYSLKDYSQVSSPTAISASNSVDSRNLSGIKHGGLFSQVPGRNIGGKNVHIKQNKTSQFAFVSRPQAAVLTPPDTASGASRMDRMRKLLVSPLNIRLNPHQLGARRFSGLNINGGATGRGATALLNKSHHHFIGRASRNTSSRKQSAKTGGTQQFRVYGCPLQLANDIYPITSFGSQATEVYRQQHVPYVLARLCNYIEQNSSQLTHEGIFRVSGNVRLTEKLKTLFDRLGDAPLESESVDVATSASMLKMYLRELPEPLIPTRLNGYFFGIAKKYFPPASSGSSSSCQLNRRIGPTIYTGLAREMSHDERDKLQAFSRDLSKLLKKLPPENYNVLKYLACFLYRVSLKQKYNKMCAEALGIVFGPNVFRINGNSIKHLKEHELSNMMMAAIISNYQLIFDGRITDPLGNVVQTDRADWSPSKLKQSSELSSSASLKGASEIFGQADLDTNVENRARNDKSSPGTSSEALAKGYGPSVIQPEPSTSATASGSGPSSSADKQDDESESISYVHKRHVCCKRFCKRASNRLGIVSGDDSGDDGDDSNDGDEDGEVSYGSVSGSGSFCSSVDSESVGSSYDDEADDDDDFYGDDDDGEDIDISSQLSTSECPESQTPSYTPSSSPVSDLAMGQGQNEQRGGASSDHNGSKSSTGCIECIKRRQSLAVATPSSHVGPQIASSMQKAATEGSVDTENVKEVMKSSVSDEQPSVHIRAALSNRRANLQRTDKSTKRSALFARRSSSTSSLSQMLKKNVANRHRGQHGQASRIAHRRGISGNQTAEQNSTHRRRHLRAVYAAESSSRHHRSSRPHHHRPSGSIRMRRGEGCCGFKATSTAQCNRRCDRFGEESNQYVMDSSGRSDGYFNRLLNNFLRVGSDLWAPNQGDDFELIEYPIDESQEDFAVIRPYNSDEILYQSSTFYNEFVDSLSFATANTRGRRFSGHEILTCGMKRLNLVPMSVVAPIGEHYYEDLDEIHDIQSPLITDPLVGKIKKLSLVDTPILDNLGSSLVEDQIAHATMAETLIDNIDELGFAELESGLDNSLMNIFEPNQDASSDVVRSQASIDVNLSDKDYGISLHLRTLGALIRALRELSKHLIMDRVDVINDDLESKLIGLVEFDKDQDDSKQYGDESICHVDCKAAYCLAKLLMEYVDKKSKNNLDSQNALMTTDEYEQRLKGLIGILERKISCIMETYLHLCQIRDHCQLKHSYPSGQDRIEAKSENEHGRFDEKEIPKEAATDENEQIGSVDCLMSVGSASFGSISKSSSTPSLEQTIKQTSKTSAAVGEQVCNENQGDEILARVGSPSNEPSIDCQFGSPCPIEFVFNIEKRMAHKRLAQNRIFLKLTEMNEEQLSIEKVELKKNLLRYQRKFGRPTTMESNENFICHLYERYSIIKRLMKKRSRQRLLNSIAQDS